jgi:hypothetical protein
MAVIIMFCLIIFPLYDEVDNYALEKDVIIRSDARNFVDHKLKKHAVSFNASLENILPIFSYKPKIPKPLAIIPFFDFFHSFSSSILRL